MVLTLAMDVRGEKEASITRTGCTCHTMSSPRSRYCSSPMVTSKGRSGCDLTCLIRVVCPLHRVSYCKRVAVLICGSICYSLLDILHRRTCGRGTGLA